MKTEEKRGRGRAASDGYTDLRKGSVSLTQDMWDYLHAQGGGNYNVGLRSVLSKILQCPPRGVTATPEDVARKNRMLLKQCRAVMESEGLRYVNGNWHRAGVRLNISALRRLYTEYPELEEYTNLNK